MAGADLPAHPFDLANAAALLAAVGWADTNGDGILEAHAVPGMPDDTPLRFEVTASDTFLRTYVSGRIAAQLRSCGMDVTVQQAPARDLLAQNAEALFSGRRFQLAEVSSTMSVEALCALSVTDGISSEANGWTGSNLGGYSDPAMDAACAAVAASLPGSADYVSTRQTALRIFSEQLLVLPLFPYARLADIRPDLSGFTSRFDPWSQLQNVEDFRLEP
jgi:ABC-type transport system substrate-binding protein